MSKFIKNSKNFHYCLFLLKKRKSSNEPHHISSKHSKGGLMSTIQKLLEGKKSATPEPAIVEESRKNSAEHHRPSKFDENADGNSSNVAKPEATGDGPAVPSIVIEPGDNKQEKRSPSQQPEQSSGENKINKQANDSASSSQRFSLFSKVFSSKSKSKSPEKKYLDEFAVEEDGTKLPMVKFDSDGDFFKEPLEGKYKE